MTPKDFSSITGLLVCGKSLEYDMEAHTKIEEMVRLFGDPIRSILNANTGTLLISTRGGSLKPLNKKTS